MLVIAVLLVVLCRSSVAVSIRLKRAGDCVGHYKRIPGHTACLEKDPQVTKSGVSEADKKTIVALHNKFRNDVTPTATDMLKMTWDNEAAMIAQKWAEQCTIEHDENKNRIIPGQFGLGQNLAFGQSTWTQAINGWHGEVKDFSYGVGATSAKAVGHYTQVVWAKSRVVGCGYAYCPDITYKSVYACNYGPGGNLLSSKTKPYTSGASASACPNHKEGNLCACDNVCYNDAPWDLSTCGCTCKKNFQYGPSCKLNCTKAEAEESCPYTDPQACTTYSNVPAECPVKCGICPLTPRKDAHGGNNGGGGKGGDDRSNTAGLHTQGHTTLLTILTGSLSLIIVTLIA